MLIIRLRPLGDMVLLTPALAALHGWRPDLRLTVLAEPGVAPVLEGNPDVEEILLYRGLLSCVKQIRARRFAAVFNQHSGPTSALLTGASGIPIRVCWVRRQFSFIYNVKAGSPPVFYGRDDVHTVEQRLTQFYAAGMPQAPIPAASVYPTSDETDSMRGLLASRGIAAEDGYAVVRPGATHPAKRWAAEKFAEIAQWLRAEKNIQTIVNLGPGDEGLKAPVQTLCGRAVPLVDQLSLRELIALLAGARLFVGNDAGPTHIAAAAGCAVAVIFGSSNPVHWRPWGVNYRLLQSALPATPGLPSISIDDVKRACCQLLSDREQADQGLCGAAKASFWQGSDE